MASVRNALFLFAFVVVVGGVVDSAAFQQSDYNKHRSSSVWSAKMSPVDTFSLWRNDDDDTVRVDTVKGCCLSKVWAGTAFGVTTIEEEGGKRQTHTAKYVVNIDLVNRRIAEDITADNDVTRSTIALCDKSGGGTLYYFVRATKQCQKVPVPHCPVGPDPVCFPSNGDLLASFSLGAGPGALRTQLWGYRAGKSVTEVLLTPDNCVPLVVASEVQLSRDQAKSTVTSESLLTNVTLSIPDLSVFTPPPYCNKEEDDEEGEETLAFDYQDLGINAIFPKISLFR